MTLEAPLATSNVSSPALCARGLTKQYDGTRALRWAADAELVVNGGEIHALVGENGAGKSTLMSVLAGLTQASSGSVQLAEAAYAPANIAAARHDRVEIVLQEPGLIGALTVAENFFLGRATTDTQLNFVRRRRGARIVRQALQNLAPHVSPSAPVASLGLEDQKLVELARAIHFRPRVLLIDEITACLGQAAVSKLFTALREQRAAGAAVVYISHHLEEVRELADRVTVLRDGQLVATLPTASVDDRSLTTLMVGRDLSTAMYRSDHREAAAAAPVLQVAQLACRDFFSDINLTVHAGEIVGIGGLVGCGSDQLARTLFGAMQPTSGRACLAGRPFRPRSPRHAIDAGVAYVPPDRDREGLLLRQSIGRNVTLTRLPQLSTAGIYFGHRERRVVGKLIEKLSIKCRGEKELPLNLSGGNRQKVVLAKWLLTQPRLFILHNPTRGVDVGAKSEIYHLIDQLAQNGAAVLLLSDELPELIGMSDRILIMRAGRLVHEARREQHPTQDELITHMV